MRNLLSYVHRFFLRNKQLEIRKLQEILKVHLIIFGNDLEILLSLPFLTLSFCGT